MAQRQYRRDIVDRLRLALQAAELDEDAHWDEKALAFRSRDKILHIEVDRVTQVATVRVVFGSRDNVAFGPTHDVLSLVHEYEAQRTRFDWKRLS